MIYELSEEQYQRIIEASKPVPYLVIGGMPPESPRVKAERVWQSLGKEMGFKWDTARPSSKGDHFFEAEPSQKTEEGR